MAAPYKHVTLITGANQGIGFETAKKLATEHSDYHVILTGRSEKALHEAVAKLNALGLSNVEPIVLDITSDESIAAAVKAVESKHGRLDVLINNAAVSTLEHGSPRELFVSVYNINVVSQAMVTDAFIPLLEKAQFTKRVVNVTSGLGSMQDKLDRSAFIHKVDHPPYSVSKSALNQLTLHYVTRYEDDPTWKFNLTCPGFCATNLNNYAGTDDPALGAVNSCRLATLGLDGPTGTWTNRNGTIKW